MSVIGLVLLLALIPTQIASSRMSNQCCVNGNENTCFITLNCTTGGIHDVTVYYYKTTGQGYQSCPDVNSTDVTICDTLNTCNITVTTAHNQCKCGNATYTCEAATSTVSSSTATEPSTFSPSTSSTTAVPSTSSSPKSSTSSTIAVPSTSSSPTSSTTAASSVSSSSSVSSTSVDTPTSTISTSGTTTSESNLTSTISENTPNSPSITTPGGNQGSTEPVGSKERPPNTVAIAVGVPLSLIAIINIGVLAFCLIRRRKKHSKQSELKNGVRNISYETEGGVCNIGPMGPQGMTGPQANTTISDNNYIELTEPQNIYNEPGDIDEDPDKPRQWQPGEDTYNRIRFQDKEIFVDPGYGTLGPKQMPERDSEYSHIIDQAQKSSGNQYSQVTTLENGKQDRSRTGGGDEKSRMADGIYNHLGETDQQNITPENHNDAQADEYSHLGKGTISGPAARSPTGNGAVYSEVNKRKVGSLSDETKVTTPPSYELAKPFENKQEETIVGRPVEYSIAKPFPGEKQTFEVQDTGRNPKVQSNDGVIQNQFQSSQKPVLTLTKQEDTSTSHSYFTLERVNH